ncbi:MAG: peptidylprolyl isomerase [Acidobacteria bacterium]|nr:peptidylprolyl isomerase [Acidobacteriota bacterium]
MKLVHTITALALIVLWGCGPSQAPPKFRAKFETSHGNFVIEVTRDWAPLGADRFHELVKAGFFDECRFFRVLPGFVVQFGINGDPALNEKWKENRIQDDPPLQSNAPATVTFATSGPNTRTTQLFISLANNDRLDPQGFTPFGRVVEGMENVVEFHSAYGEGFPNGAGPDQKKIQAEGNAYLKKDFPRLDYIKKAYIVEQK